MECRALSRVLNGGKTLICRDERKSFSGKGLIGAKQYWWGKFREIRTSVSGQSMCT